MKALLLRLLILAAALSLAAGPLWAQRGGGRKLIGGSVNGWVRDRHTNAPIQGAVVELQSDMGEIIEQAIVGSSGRFEFNSLGRTAYYLVARAGGYKTSIRVRVDLRASPHRTAVLALEPLETKHQQQSTSPDPLVDVRSLAIPEEARQEFDEARKSLREKKDLPGAVSHLRKATTLYPEYVQAYHLLGTLYMDQAEWELARKSLKRALELNERFAPSYFAWGAMLNRRGKPAKAQEVLERGLEFDPNAWQGHVEICKSYYAVGDLTEAVEHALRAHSLSPEISVIHLVLADVYVADGSYTEAKTEYQHFLDRAPSSPWRARILEQIRRLDGALEPSSAAAEQAPRR